MKLYQMLKDYPLRHFRGSALTEIGSIVYDSRKVLEAACFVCLSGEQEDGHHYVHEAIERKAAAILSNWPVPPEVEKELAQCADPPALLCVDDTRDALSFISRNFYAYDQRELSLHLLVGELGKSSCADMLYRLLTQCGRPAVLIDDMQIRRAEQTRYLSRTHPEMPELCAVLSELEAATVFLPFSQRDLALQRGRYLEPELCLLLQADAAEVGRVLGLLGPATQILLNQDALSEEGLALLAPYRKRLLRFGVERSADIRARELRIETRGEVTGTSFQLDFPDGQSGAFFVALPGRHHVYNALALLSWAWYAEVDLEDCRRFLAELSQPGRSELVFAAESDETGSNAFTLLIDNAWSAPQLAALLQSLRPYCRRHLLVLASAGGAREAQQRHELGRVAAELADYVCFTVSDPRSEEAASILDDLTAWLDPATVHFDALPERADAVRRLIAQAKPGDLLVLTGKARDSYRMEARSSEPFSEYELAREILRELRPKTAAGSDLEALRAEPCETPDTEAPEPVISGDDLV